MLFSRSVVSDSFAIPWTVECQAPLSMGFPRQEYWSGLPFILQGIFPSQGSTLHLLHWQEDSLPLSHEGSPVLGTALDKCYLLLLHLSFFFFFIYFYQLEANYFTTFQWVLYIFLL